MTDGHEKPQEAAASNRPVNPVDEAIGTEARYMIRGIKLGDKITARDRDRVIALVKRHQAEFKITNTVIALGTGLGKSTVSEVLSGVYKGDFDAAIRKLNGWVETDSQRRARNKPLGFFHTNVFIALRDAAAFAKKRGRTSYARSVEIEPSRIVLAFGEAGCGKSVGAKALYADDPSIILIRIDEGAGTGSGVASAVIAAETWRRSSGRVRYRDVVRDRLHNTGRLLIVDEGQRLVRGGREFLRDLADVAGVPILIMGNDTMRLRVETVRRGAGSEMDSQFASRVALTMDLVKGRDGAGGDRRPIYSLDEIRAIFRSNRVRLSADGAEYLQAIACILTRGMLRMASNVWEIAVLGAARNQGLVDAALCRKAFERCAMTAGWFDQIVIREVEGHIETNRKMGAGLAAAS